MCQCVRMDIGFFHRILEIDSTSGNERALAEFLAAHMSGPGRKVELSEVKSMAESAGDSGVPLNLMVSWGKPKLVFCTHLDTVPPYIAPSFTELCVSAGKTDVKISGRGTCDAKGQIFAMWEACKELERRGYEGFALLFLAGEETGSYGAKAFSEHCQGAEWLVVGEPTDNCMASASKGTKSFEVSFTGKAFHSGYPQYGCSAVEMFGDFLNALRSIVFPQDELLGDTTWNIGRLISDNPQNILSDRLSCRLYFRTTFESDEMVCNIMKNIAGEDARLRFGQRRVQDGSDIVSKEVAPWQKAMSVKAFGGDAPAGYEVLEGFESKPVSFGSDAPQLSRFGRKILCGPGSILVAHRDEEHIMLSDIEKAVANYVSIFEQVSRS